MRRISALATLLLPLIASAQAPQTLRVDYFHGGDAASETFSLDQVMEKLQAGGGSK